MALSKSTRISIMLGIDIVFFLVELISGFLVHSLALTADAFHMLNDIISLCVGLWAVRVATRGSTPKYSYGWVRAEILGAFFNAVFLIALCVSIVLESITRFIEPPEISNPQLILIVGCFGLASNLVGFLVLDGHGHSHGHDHGDGHSHDHGHEHVHDHNDASAAEEGRASYIPNGEGQTIVTTKTGNESPETARRIRFDSPENGSRSSRGREGRRASSLKHGRLQSIDDLNLYPSSFRQNIIEHSRSGVEDTDESSAEDGESAADENSPLIVQRGNEATYGTKAGDDAHAERSASHKPRARRDSTVHKEHHHNKPKKATKGHGGHGHDHGDMGMNAMVLHVIGDALGNVGVIITALIIWLTDWPGKYYADPAVSLFITLIILRSCIPLTKATSKVLLQATPESIDIQDIKEDIQTLKGVVSCHHVHVWQLSNTKIVASMHIQVSFPITEEGGEKYMALAKQARKCLHAYGIHSATIQPEFCLDQMCDHAQDAAAVTLDGHESPRCRTGEPIPCFLNCVENCDQDGCCSVSTSPHGDALSGTSNHSHDHDHDHGHDHDHDHESHDHSHH